MTNYTINAMNDLYSTISFGGGGSSGSSGGTGHATLGPGGGSDPGNAGYPNPGLSSGPLTSTQSNLVTAGLIGLTTT